MRYRGLRAAPQESPLQRVQVVGGALQAHVHLLVVPVVIGVGVTLVGSVRVVFVVLR